MIYIAVYGSLRVGNYNYDRIIRLFPNQFNFIQDGIVPGYKMFDIGHYPAVLPTKDDTNEISIDIIECGKEPAAYIRAMEYGAGYKEAKLVVNGYNCILYYMNAVDLIPYPEVKDGDWNKYLTKINT